MAGDRNLEHAAPRPIPNAPMYQVFPLGICFGKQERERQAQRDRESGAGVGSGGGQPEVRQPTETLDHPPLPSPTAYGTGPFMPRSARVGIGTILDSQ